MAIMSLPSYKIRIIANACITRWDGGEREITDIVASYNLTETDSTAVLTEIGAKRPDIYQAP